MREIIADRVQPSDGRPEPFFGAVLPVEEGHTHLGERVEPQPRPLQHLRFSSNVIQARIQLFLNEEMPLQDDQCKVVSRRKEMRANRRSESGLGLKLPRFGGRWTASAPAGAPADKTG